MKQKNILLTALVAIAVISFSSCKLEEAKPATEVVFGSAEIQLILEANLDRTNDTTEYGSPSVTNEKVEGVMVIATVNRWNFYSDTSGNYENEVVTGVTDANGSVTLSVPVGQRDNIRYDLSMAEKLVNVRYSTNVDDTLIIKTQELILFYGDTYFDASKEAKEIRRIQMSLK